MLLILRYSLVFINKDYSKPAIHIHSVPMQSLDTIKDWLNSCDIKFYEGPTNLNWDKILETIRKDTKGFYETGG